MNEMKLRLIDAWVGKLLCLLLTWHRRLFGGKAAPGGEPPRRLMFIKLIEQGASVLAADAFDRAVQMVGRDNTYICVFVENREILDFLDIIPKANILAVRNGNFVHMAIDLVKVIIFARRQGIDATVDLEFLSRGAAILAYMTGAKRRSGIDGFTIDGPYRGDLLTHKVSYNPYLHVASTYRLLVDALLRTPDREPINKIPPPQASYQPRFRPKADEVARVEGKLAELLGAKLPAGPRIILNPNAGDLMPLRKWPTDRFIELATKLKAVYPDATFILTGAPRERPLAERIRDQMAAAFTAAGLLPSGQAAGVLSTAGHTTLRELIVLFGLCDVLVTNDSGPAHFASMTKIANIVLFGPETPLLYGPVAGAPLTITAGLACSPCINSLNQRLSPCTNNVCMQAITTERVAEAVQQMLRPASRAETDGSSGRAGAKSTAVGEPAGTTTPWQTSLSSGSQHSL